MICGNRLGELSGPVLDPTDAGNLTPTGGEGPGVAASPGCEDPDIVYGDTRGADGVPGTEDDDLSLAPGSPAIDRGTDPRTLGLDPRLDPIFESDFTRDGVRPDGGGDAAAGIFDIGAFEALPDAALAVAILAPAPGAWVRADLVVEALAVGAEVESIDFLLDSVALGTARNSEPGDAFTARLSLDTRTIGDGDHVLRAVALDRGGRSASASARITVDNEPPDTLITAGPGDEAPAEVTFGLAGSDNLAAQPTFAWRLDGGPYSGFSAASIVFLSGLADGPHLFEVKARDMAGNEDPSPARWAFTVATAPSIAGVTPASGPPGTAVTVTGSRFEPGATQVAFGGVPAPLLSMAPGSLTTSVPAGATTGPLTVTTPRGSAVWPFTVSAAPDFVLDAAPALALLPQGGEALYLVGVQALGGFGGAVSLGVSGLPAGASAAFAPATLAPGEQGLVTVRAEPGTMPGRWSFTVTGTADIEGSPRRRSLSLVAEILAPGRTVLAGRFLTADGAPLPGVRLALEALGTMTDAAGGFVLAEAPAGLRQLMVDASAARPGFPIYAVEVTLPGGETTTLEPLHITPPPPDARFTLIDNASRDQVITEPRFPGLAITLPAGTTITGWDGRLKTRIAVERLEPDRLPVPPPPGPTRSLYQIFFGTPMGGIPSTPLPLTLPNDQDLLPGEKAELWYYDASPLGGAAGWRLAGEGTVSADGLAIVSDPGTGLARFCGVCGLACFIARQRAQPNLNPAGPRAGEPVDLGTGQMIVEAADLVLRGRIPAVVHRTYNPFDPFGAGGFELGLGPGWALSIDIALQEEGATLRRLVLPGNARLAFTREADGTFVNTTHARFARAVLSQAGTEHVLRLEDGTTWRFASGWLPWNRAQPITGLGLLVERADRDGNRLVVEREAHGRPLRLIEPAGRALAFELDASGRISRVSDPAGRSVLYGYDAARRLATVTNPAGGVTRYEYDAMGRILSIVDPRGIRFVSHEYDAQGRVAQQVQADGGTWAFEYGGPLGAHTSVTVTDPRGHRTLSRLTSAGFLAERVDALGQVTRFERDPAGRLTALTDPLGRVTRLERDAAGRVRRIVGPAGGVHALDYDPGSGLLTSLTDPAGATTRLEHDARGHLVGLVDPLGARTVITRDDLGQPSSVTDPLGQATTLARDALGNVTAITDPLGRVTRVAYDLLSRRTSVTDPRGRTTRYAHDVLDRVVAVVDPAGGVTRTEYDPNGNLLTITDARGGTVTHTYDAMDRLATRTDGVGAVESFRYDEAGNPTAHRDRKGQESVFAYDPLNRREAATYADGHTTRFTYDAVGRLLEAVDSAGPAVSRRYDALGRLLAETGALGTVTYARDALGRRVRMEAPGQAPVSYGYDAAGRLTTMAQGERVVTLEHDAAGRRTRLTLPNGVSTAYRYDAASQLTGLVYEGPGGVLGDLGYEYDAAGHRERAAGSLALTLLPEPVGLADHDMGNRQRRFGERAMDHDANGNIVAVTDTVGTTAFLWDARDRLVGVDGPGGAVSFGYDALGRRATRSANGSFTQYLHDGLDVVEEVTDGIRATYLHGPGVDEPLARDGGEFYLADALGSVLALTDTSGALRTRYLYEPFGRTESLGQPSANPFQYAGRENDGIDGLYWYRARPYAPGLHRFLAEDPIGVLGGLNAYEYALGNPVAFRDPLGLDVTLYYYKGDFSGPMARWAFPHVAVQVDGGPVHGFYPRPEYRGLGAVLGRVPGDLRIDYDRPDRSDKRHTIAATSAQDELIRGAILEALSRQALGQGEPYNALGVGGRNCVTFITHVLQQAGLQVPDFVSPAGMIPYARQAFAPALGDTTGGTP
jgi:RHS repeat-associated protein